MFGLFKKLNSRGEWRKVSQLSVGMEIAVPRTGLLDEHQAGVLEARANVADNDILWDEIVSIEHVGEERVYDIEVEETHNFVGNNIFAHNTAIFGGGVVSMGTSTSVSGTQLFVQGQGNNIPLNVASSSGTSLMTVLANGNVGIGTTSPQNNLHVYSTTAAGGITIDGNTAVGLSLNINNVNKGILGVAQTASQFTPDAGAGDLILRTNSTKILFNTNNGGGNSAMVIDTLGNVGIGTTGPISLLTLQGSTNTSGANAIAGIYASTTLAGSTLNGFEFGNRMVSTIAPTATGTYDGLFVRTVDNGTLGNTVRGIEVQAYSGTNTYGTNAGITAFGHTFGVQGITDGLAGGVTQPAGVYAELDNPTVGNAFRAYSNTSTTASLVSVYQESSAYTGDALVMSLANNSGTFATGNFINLKLANTSVASINSAGNLKVTLGASTLNHAICHENSGTGLDTLEDCTGAPGADFQEIYPTDGAVTWGDVVTVSSSTVTTTIGNSLQVLTKSATAYDSSVIGIASNPADSGDFNTIGYNLASTTNPYPIALVGRVEVKIATSSAINAGDFLTSSNIAGVAMKATRSGMVLGQALINYDPATNTSSNPSILMFVKPGYQIINNTFVLGQNDGQLASATSTAGVSQETMLIDQTGAGNLLQLQQNGEDRLLIANNGSFNLFASTTIATSTILAVSNGTTTQFAISAAGHITVGQDTAGTATIKAGDNQTTVTFAVAYDTVPKIAVTIQGLPSFFYGVATKTPDGFAIQTSATMTADTLFDWIALAQPATSTSQSSLNAQIVVVSQPSGNAQIAGGGSPSGGTSSATITPDTSQTSPSESGQVAGTSTTASDVVAPAPTDTTTAAPAADTSAAAPDTSATPPADTSPAKTSDGSLGGQAPAAAPAPADTSAPAPVSDAAPAPTTP